MTNILSYYHNLRCRHAGLLLVVKFYIVSRAVVGSEKEPLHEKRVLGLILAVTPLIQSTPY